VKQFKKDYKKDVNKEYGGVRKSAVALIVAFFSNGSITRVIRFRLTAPKFAPPRSANFAYTENVKCN